LEKAAKERSEILRGHYIMTIEMYFQLEQLIFIDESAKDERTACRQYGYSPRNQAAVKKLPNMNAFPQQNNVLVMDNAQIHHDEYLVNFI
ncbi:hypothetical protein RhiirA5_263732, partial [Rhizophagus irregularis]